MGTLHTQYYTQHLPVSLWLDIRIRFDYSTQHVLQHAKALNGHSGTREYIWLFCPFWTENLSFLNWHFRFMLMTDLSNGSTAVEKGNFLTAHQATPQWPHRKLQAALCRWCGSICDRSMFSVLPDSDGLVSIEELGYVEANYTFHNEEMAWFRHMETSPGKPDERQRVHVQYAYY